MAQAWRIEDETDEAEPKTQRRPTRSGTIRVDETELAEATSRMRHTSRAPEDAEDESDTVTSAGGIPLREPLREARSGYCLSQGEPLCAVVTPGALSEDPMTGRKRALLLVRDPSSCALVDRVRRESDDLLRKDEERLRLAMECGRMVACELGFSTGTIHLAGDVPGVLGVAAGHWPLRLLMEHIHPEDRVLIDDLLFHAGRDGTPVDADFRWIRPTDRRVSWLEMRSRASASERGEIVSLSGLLVDVTARKRAEEVRARSVELEALRQRMEDVSRVRTQFLANMSHDFRTPLNAIIGFTQLIHDGHVSPGSEQQQELTGDVLSAAQRLLGFIDELLDVAELEARTADSIGRARHDSVR